MDARPKGAWRVSGHPNGYGHNLSERFVRLAEEVAGASQEELAEIFMLATFFHERFMSLYERPDVPRLTPREREVLRWAAGGKADFDIGCILGVSASTVRFHWKNIFEKLGVKGRMRAVVKAMQLRLISLHLIGSPFQN